LKKEQAKRNQLEKEEEKMTKAKLELSIDLEKKHEEKMNKLIKE